MEASGKCLLQLLDTSVFETGSFGESELDDLSRLAAGTPQGSSFVILPSAGTTSVRRTLAPRFLMGVRDGTEVLLLMQLRLS